MTGGPRDEDAPLGVGCLVSGGGRTVVNLARAIESDAIPAEIRVVVAHRPSIAGVERCRAAGLRVVVVPLEDADDPRSLADRTDEALEAAGVELVCLAGYLRHFRVDPRWTGRVVNIHPSLLPRHGGRGMYGDRVHEAVLAAGDAESGCTVHLVDEIYDHGPVIHQRTCPVEPGDTKETLAARVFAEECRAFPEVVAAVADGRGRLEDGMVLGSVRGEC